MDAADTWDSMAGKYSVATTLAPGQATFVFLCNGGTLALSLVLSGGRRGSRWRVAWRIACIQVTRGGAS